MFMRYISHEMRTPLNVACLGIKILRDELERLGLLNLLETAIDTEKSCKTAVDILNDMLLFDKIVSGLMTLEKRRFDPLDFIGKVMGPFHLQVLFRSFPSWLLYVFMNHCVARPGMPASTFSWSRISPSRRRLFDCMLTHTRSRK